MGEVEFKTYLFCTVYDNIRNIIDNLSVNALTKQILAYTYSASAVIDIPLNKLQHRLLL